MAIVSTAKAMVAVVMDIMIMSMNIIMIIMVMVIIIAVVPLQVRTDDHPIVLRAIVAVSFVPI